MARPENRTEFLETFRQISDPDQYTEHYVASDQLDRILNAALDLYSSRCPVEGLEATLVMTAGSRDVPLPADWLKGYPLNEEILQAIEQGRDPRDKVPDHSALNFRGNNRTYIGGNPYDPYSNNLSQPLRPPSAPLPRPTITKKWVDGALVPVFVMRYDLNTSTEWDVTYFGRHQVEDGLEDPLTDSINTVEDEAIVFEIMGGLIIKGNAFNPTLNGGNPAKCLTDGQAIIDAALAKITPKSIRRR